MNPFLNWKMNEISYKRKTKSNGELGFGLVDKETAKKITIENHYSKKWNTLFGLLNIGVYKDDRLLGVAVFGRMMNPKSFNKIIEGGNIDSILELNRLWVSDELGHNTESLLLSVCMKYIKTNMREVKLIQSFADGRLGCGTVYKASNFKYYGKMKTKFLEDVETGEVFTQSQIRNTRRRTKFVELNLLYIKDKLRSFEVYTYRYIYILDKKVKIKLKEHEYPEYSKGYVYKEGWIPSCNQLAKLIHILKSSDHEDVDIVIDYMKKHYSENQIKESEKIAEKYFQQNP